MTAHTAAEPLARPTWSWALVPALLACLAAPAFFVRYSLQPGYLTDSNAYFEKTHSIPARWNRLLVYSGMLFHSGEISNPQALNDDPRTGRLTLNGFFTGRMTLR